jgi:hypothetical protein
MRACRRLSPADAVPGAGIFPQILLAPMHFSKWINVGGVQIQINMNSDYFK